MSGEMHNCQDGVFACMLVASMTVVSLEDDLAGAEDALIRRASARPAHLNNRSNGWLFQRGCQVVELT